MLGFGAIGQFAIGQAQATVAETVTPDKWGYGLSTPVCTKIKWAAVALAASGYSHVPAAPFPERVMESKWHQPLSEPVRQKNGLRASLQQAFTVGDIIQLPANISVYIDVQETPDSAEFVINTLGTLPTRAIVSISEVAPVYASMTVAVEPSVFANVTVCEIASISAIVTIVESQG